MRASSVSLHLDTQQWQQHATSMHWMRLVVVVMMPNMVLTYSAQK